MANVIRIIVEDIDVVIATYSKIELESASSLGGVYSEITELTLVADDHYYSYEDSAGVASTWYRYRYSNAGSSVRSDYSNPFQVTGATRKLIRQQALKDYKAGMILTQSASAGSATTVLTDDARFKTSLYATDRGKGTWLHPSSGSRAGETRRITTTTPSTGTFTVNPAMSGALASGDEFEWHWLADPYEWDLAINQGLKRYKYLDRIPLVGEASNTNPEFDLSIVPDLTNKDDVIGLYYYRTPDSIQAPWGQGGRWWDIRQDGSVFTLITYPALTDQDTVYMEYLRNMPEVFTDASVLPSACNIELAAALAYDQLLAMIQRPQSYGSASDRPGWIRERLTHQKRLVSLWRQYGPKPKRQHPQSAYPAVVPSPVRAR